jgi:hypothetical protein
LKSLQSILEPFVVFLVSIFLVGFSSFDLATRHFLAARGMADRWTSPDRLHAAWLKLLGPLSCAVKFDLQAWPKMSAWYIDP